LQVLCYRERTWTPFSAKKAGRSIANSEERT
jgi:hypothetical protein